AARFRAPRSPDRGTPRGAADSAQPLLPVPPEPTSSTRLRHSVDNSLHHPHVTIIRGRIVQTLPRSARWAIARNGRRRRVRGATRSHGGHKSVLRSPAPAPSTPPNLP